MMPGDQWNLIVDVAGVGRRKRGALSALSALSALVEYRYGLEVMVTWSDSDDAGDRRIPARVGRPILPVAIVRG